VVCLPELRLTLHALPLTLTNQARGPIGDLVVVSRESMWKEAQHNTTGLESWTPHCPHHSCLRRLAGQARCEFRVGVPLQRHSIHVPCLMRKHQRYERFTSSWLLRPHLCVGVNQLAVGQQTLLS